MTTKKYLETLLNGAGHLNPNPNKKLNTHPDYLGYIKVEDKPFRISAWVKSTKDNKKFLSINLNELQPIEINEV